MRIDLSKYKTSEYIYADPLYMYDLGQQLELVNSDDIPSEFEAHFHNVSMDKAIVQMVEGTVITIPNIMLRSDKTIVCDLFRRNESSGTTLRRIFIPLLDKPKPSDVEFIETPERYWTINDIFNLGSEKLGVDVAYVHNQLMPSTVWTIDHDLKKHPSVTIVDSGGSVVYGSVLYESKNRLVVTFTAPFSGRAFLN